MATTKSKIVPLPGKLWIGGFEVGVRVVPHDHELLALEEGGFGRGMAHRDPDKWLGIALSRGLPLRELLEVMLHETTHLVNFLNDISEDDEPITEEDVADKHGKAWSQLWLDNPRFLKWLVYITARIRKDQKAHNDAEAEEPQAPHPSGHAVEAGSPAGAHEVGGAIRGTEKA